jgi:hypothetical protein
MRYTAIFILSNGTVISNAVDTTDAQTLYNDAPELNVETIIVMQNGLTQFGGPLVGVDVQPPAVIATYQRGKDFNHRVESLDAVCETIKNWLDGIDDPQVIANLLAHVTGAVNVRVIKQDDAGNALIGYDMP